MKAQDCGNERCALPWPSAWATLSPGADYLLTIESRTRPLAGSWVASEPIILTMLGRQEGEEVQAHLQTIEGLEIDPVTRSLLTAGLYAERQLFSEAIPLYEAYLSAQAVPEVYVTVGDLYRQIGLTRPARGAYEKVLTLVPHEDEQPLARAAAEFGLGWVYQANNNYPEAERHYAEAVRLYEPFGASDELTAAQEGLQAIREAQ